MVNNVKADLPKMQAVLPNDIRVRFEFDQSPYVTNSVKGVAYEGGLAADGREHYLRGLLRPVRDRTGQWS